VDLYREATLRPRVRGERGVHWEAVANDGEVFGVGLNFLVLAADGRIERDYTFLVA
jgi:hypothetical protein